jgi:hypothetical protein
VSAPFRRLEEGHQHWKKIVPLPIQLMGVQLNARSSLPYPIIVKLLICKNKNLE